MSPDSSLSFRHTSSFYPFLYKKQPNSSACPTHSQLVSQEEKAKSIHFLSKPKLTSRPYKQLPRKLENSYKISHGLFVVYFI